MGNSASNAANVHNSILKQHQIESRQQSLHEHVAHVCLKHLLKLDAGLHLRVLDG